MTENTKPIYTHCYGCDKALLEGDKAVAIHQYIYCSKKCVLKQIETLVLGDVEETEVAEGTETNKCCKIDFDDLED